VPADATAIGDPLMDTPTSRRTGPLLGTRTHGRTAGWFARRGGLHGGVVCTAGWFARLGGLPAGRSGRRGGLHGWVVCRLGGLGGGGVLLAPAPATADLTQAWRTTLRDATATLAAHRSGGASRLHAALLR
jgi:hypothetical protein